MQKKRRHARRLRAVPSTPPPNRESTTASTATTTKISGNSSSSSSLQTKRKDFRVLTYNLFVRSPMLYNGCWNITKRGGDWKDERLDLFYRKAPARLRSTAFPGALLDLPLARAPQFEVMGGVRLPHRDNSVWRDGPQLPPDRLPPHRRRRRHHRKFSNLDMGKYSKI